MLHEVKVDAKAYVDVLNGDRAIELKKQEPPFKLGDELSLTSEVGKVRFWIASIVGGSTFGIREGHQLIGLTKSYT